VNNLEFYFAISRKRRFYVFRFYMPFVLFLAYNDSRLSSQSCLDVLGTHSTNKILRLRSPICRTWTAPFDNSMLVYIMSGYPPVDSSSVSNNLRTIFESLSYGPAPEADDVAQVVVSFNCHCQFA